MVNLLSLLLSLTGLYFFNIVYRLVIYREIRVICLVHFEEARASLSASTKQQQP